VLLAAATLGAGRAAGAEELLVFAAASTAEALDEIGRAFSVESGVTVRFSFAGSNDLARQIRLGAPADVFLSADRATMAPLVEIGRVAAPRALVSNQLVVVVPRASTLRLGAPADLVRARRLALADPTAVPAGVYARAWLQSIGLWPALRDKVVPALDVRAALAAVESGAVDAGVVYRTDAAHSTRARVAFEVSRDAGPPITYMVAAVAGARHASAVAAFVRFLGGAAARAIFTRHGFIVL
jgi:molybdate transport system substrate-binding protein